MCTYQSRSVLYRTAHKYLIARTPDINWLGSPVSGAAESCILQILLMLQLIVPLILPVFNPTHWATAIRCAPGPREFFEGTASMQYAAACVKLIWYSRCYYRVVLVVSVSLALFSLLFRSWSSILLQESGLDILPFPLRGSLAFSLSTMGNCSESSPAPFLSSSRLRGPMIYYYHPNLTMTYRHHSDVLEP